MFKTSLLAAALLIAGGTAASAAEIGVRHSQGTSYTNTYGGIRVFESDTVSSGASDFRGVSVSITGSDRKALRGAAQNGVQPALSAAQGLQTANAPVLSATGVSVGDANAPGSLAGGGAQQNGSGSTTNGANDTAPGAYANVSVGITREATRMRGRTQLNESSLFNSGSKNAFSSVSTFSN